MDRASEFLQKYVHFIGRDLGLFLTSLVVALLLYAFLYCLRNSGERSLRGFFGFIFPSGAIHRSRVDFILFALGKLGWIPLFTKIVGFVLVEETSLHLLSDVFGERAISATNSISVVAGQFLFVLLVNEFAFYWGHRAMHTNRLLWPVHRPHHSAEILTFLTTERVHPLERLGMALWAAICTGCLTAVLNYSTGTAMHPLLPVIFLYWSILGNLVNIIQHSHIIVSFGPLNYIFTSGLVHQIHHSAETIHRDKNFGSLMSVFDWMFGTLYIPKKEEIFRFGLSESELGSENPHKNVMEIYCEPFCRVWRTILGSEGLDRANKTIQP